MKQFREKVNDNNAMFPSRRQLPITCMLLKVLHHFQKQEEQYKILKHLWMLQQCIAMY